MEFKEVQNLSMKELSKRASELKKDLFDLKMKNSLGQVSNPLKIRYLRKDIARTLTALNAHSKVEEKNVVSEKKETKTKKTVKKVRAKKV